MPLRLPIEQVNQYILHKQCLGSASRDGDVLSVVKDVGPLRAAPTITPYLSLWARIEDFYREQLDDALYNSRELVRVPSMRARLYLLPSSRYAAYYQATKDSLVTGLKEFVHYLLPPGIESGLAQDILGADLVQRILEVLSTRGSCTVEELGEFLPALRSRIPYDSEQPELGSAELGTRLLPALCAQGLVIRAQPRGGWRSQLDTYAALSSWLPSLNIDGLDPEEALQEVVRWYVSTFGPVAISDIHQWIGGIPRHQVRASLMRLGGELMRVEISGSRFDHLMAADQVDGLLEYVPAGRRIAMLPAHDGLLTAYSDYSRWVPDVYRERVFDQVGDPLGTVWIDDRVAGTWGLQLKEERMVVRFFEPVDTEAMALVGEEARRLAKFLEFVALDLDLGVYSEEQDDGGVQVHGYARPSLQEQGS